jgi:hypothetical protein
LRAEEAGRRNARVNDRRGGAGAARAEEQARRSAASAWGLGARITAPSFAHALQSRCGVPRRVIVCFFAVPIIIRFLLSVIAAPDRGRRACASSSQQIRRFGGSSVASVPEHPMADITTSANAGIVHQTN